MRPSSSASHYADHPPVDEDQRPAVVPRLLLNSSTQHPDPVYYGSIDAADADHDNNEDDEDNIIHHRASAAFDEARRSYLSYSHPILGTTATATTTSTAADHPHRRTHYFASLRHTVRDTVLSHTFVFPGMLVSVREAQGRATIAQSVLNLCKNIIGAGALALPSGVVAMGNASSVLWPAALALLFMGAVFAYYFHLLGRICRWTGTVSYAEAWHQSGYAGGATAVALAVALKAGSGNLECSMILADSGRDLLATAGITVTRTTALWGITLVALLPLCLLKNLSALVPFSMAGLGAMVFTAGAIAVRYWDGSYEAQPQGQFWSDLPEPRQPLFGSMGWVGAFHVRVLLFLCMISEAYIAHYNAPRFWVELKEKTVPRFGAVVSYSFGISALYYIFVTVFGFLTFGAHSAPNILNSYSTRDVLASISRFCVSFSLIFTYPIIFMGK